MKQAQRGFTLIELVMVIVILGVLAAVALPKYADLSDQANTAAAQGLAGGIASAAAVQYAGFKAGATGFTEYSSATACDAGYGTVNLGACTVSNCVVTCKTGSATAVVPD